MNAKKNRYFYTCFLTVALVAGAVSGYAAVESDLLCSYPPSTASAWGGEANARVNMANGVIGSNALNDQSGTGQHLNIVGYMMSSRDSSGEDNGYVLGLVAGDGSYSDVRNYAASVGADQVVYAPYASTGAAGNAYQPGTYSTVNSTWWWLVVVAHETGGHNYNLDHGDGHLNPKTIMLHNYCGGGAAWPYLYSNPNVWDGGVNMLGDGATTCTGSFVNGGDGAYGISSHCQSMCDTTLRVAYAPVLNKAIYHWNFTNAPGSAPAGTTNYDLVSGAPAVVRGNGARYTGNALRLPGGTTGNMAMNSMAAYIDLPDGILSSQTNITIEIWATPQSAQNWARIMDFGNSSIGEIAGNPGDAAPGTTSQTDGIMLTAAIGTDLTQQRFEAKRNGSTYTVDSALATTAGVQHHYAITFTDGAGAYGTKKSAAADSGADTLTTDQWNSTGTGNQFWIGGSADTGDGTANLNGLIDEVYVFNRPLNATEVQSLYNNNSMANNNAVVHLSFDNVSGTTVINDGTGGSAMNGVLNGGASVVSGGKFGNCLRISGANASSSSCRIASSVVPLTVGAGSSWTVAMWVKSSSAGGCYAYQGAGGWASGNTTLYFNQGNTTAGTHAGGVRYAQGWETGAATVNDGTWHQVVLSCNGTNGGRWQWYRDGFPAGLLDVSNRLANITDVNEWLGRSEWSGDNLANNDYSEVRISNVAMNQQQVTANYLLGPNYVQRSTAMVAGDLWNGSARSFSTAGNWSDGLAPSAGKSYEMSDFNLTTPNDVANHTFAGDSLRASGGIFFDGASGSSTITVNKFQIDNEEICNAAPWYNTMTLAGNLYVTNNNIIRGSGGPVVVSANLNGNGSLTLYGQPVSFSGNNTGYTGKIRVGNGIIGNLNLSSEAQLGANPPNFTSDQLILNRGWLYTTTSFAISNSNRGITIGVNDGIFDQSAGTTLTLGCPLASGYTSASGNALTTQTEPSGIVAGVLIKQNSGRLALTSSNPNYNGAISINGGTLSITNAGQLSGGSFGNPFTDNGIFDYSSSAAQIISSAIAGTGAITKNGAGTLTLSGANTLSGSVTINGGTLYANPGNAANNRAFSYVSGITVNSGGTLQAGQNGLFGWDGTQEHPITVNSGGTLTCDSGADVGVGTVTLNGGTLANVGASATWGSWCFDNAGDVLAVTADSTVSAVNVKFANGGTINVSAGKTLNFNGTITDASGGGASSVAFGGTGTVVLTGVNPFSGGATISAGTLLVNGFIGAGPVTVDSEATLGGNGTIGGPVTVQSGGTLSPGLSVGVLNASSNVTLQPGSTNLMEISKTPLTNDQLRVTGLLTLGGTLVISNLSGTLSGGDSFRLFQAGSINGAFASFKLPVLGANLAWNTSNLGSSGVLSVVSTASAKLTWNVSGANLTMTWPSDHTGWRLLTSTNLAGNNWVDVSSNSVMATNQIALPINATNDSVFYRLVYP